MKKLLLLFFVFLLTACANATLTPAGLPTRSLPTATIQPTLLPPAATLPPTETSTLAPVAPEPGVILYHSNVQRTGVYDYPAIRSPVSPLWQTDINGQVFGAPMFADGLLYVCGDNRLYIFDSQTGEQLGSIGGLGLPFSPIAITENFLIGGDITEKLVAFDRNTHRRVWAFNTDGMIYNSPLIVGQTVYAVSERGAYALDLQMGEEIWQVDMGNHRGFVGSPAYENGLLFVGVGGTFYALDSATGEIRWRIEREENQWFYSPALANGWVYVGYDDGYFYAFDQQTGEEVWKSPEAGTGWSAPVIANGVVIVGNRDQNIYAFDALTGQEIWHFETEDWATSDPVVSDGVVYVGVGNHENREGPRPLYALDAATGQLLWTFQANSRLMTAVSPGLGVIYAVTIGGTVYALSPQDAAPAAVLESGQWSVMVYHDGLRKIVLVNGGPERGKPADEPLELWAWDGETWELLDNNGPVWRNWAGVAYDSARDRLVIYGGHQNDTWFDETWEWNGHEGEWMLFDGSAPGEREGVGMVYDSARGKVVLFGGANSDFEIVGDTWEWDGQTWEQVATSGPPARFPGGVGYDPVRQQMLIYGGHDIRTDESIPFFGDFWVWDGIAWQEIPLTEPNPGIRVSTSFLFNPDRGEIMMFGGTNLESFLNDLWGWNGAQWTLIEAETTMPLRSGYNIVAFDVARGVYVLHGGVDRPGGEVVDETWEWTGTEWVCKAGCE